MLGGLGDITARTDVYLLGSLLYEVLTGQAPHEGDSMHTMIASIVLSTPKLSADVPAELAALVVRCMSRDPRERPESALAVRHALERFLEHRGAMAIAAEADKRLLELEGILAGPSNPRQIEQAYNVFGECRFGFKQALRAWDGNEVARAGLRRAIACMVRFEAEHGDARAAALLYAELDEPDPELEAIVDLARRRAEDEAKNIERLRVLEKDLDPREGRQLRMGGALAAGLLWTIVPFLAPRFMTKHPGDEALFTIPVSALCLVAIALGYRTWTRSTRINRQLVAAFAFGLAAQPLVILAAKYAAHLDGQMNIVMLMGYWFVVMGLITAALERRLVPLPLAYGAGFFVALAYPAYRYDAVSVANFIAAVTAAIVWSRRGTEAAIERDKRREARGTIC
jgi:hypothetical protein